MTTARKAAGLWLNWCDVDGYTTSACACSHGKTKTWFPNWEAAEQADKLRRIAARARREYEQNK